MIQLEYLKSLINRNINVGNFPFEVHGVKSVTALGLVLPDLVKDDPEKRSHLVVLPSDESIDALSDALGLLGYSNFIKWYKDDNSPYTSIFPSYRSIGRKTGFLASKALGLHSVYLVHASNLSIKLSPESFFSELSLKIKKGEEIPDRFIYQLQGLGYRVVDTVEDPLSFSNRGELIDIYPPHSNWPVRIELFDTEIESIRFFDPENQRSSELIEELSIPPAVEVLYEHSDLEIVIKKWKSSCEQNGIDWVLKKDYVSKLTRRQYFDGIQYLVSYFHEDSSSLFDYFKSDNIWYYDAHDGFRSWEINYSEKKDSYKNCDPIEVAPPLQDLYFEPEELQKLSTRNIFVNPFRIDDEFGVKDTHTFELDMKLTATSLFSTNEAKPVSTLSIADKIKAWRHQDFKVLCLFSSPTQLERSKLLVTKDGLKYHQLKSIEEIPNSFDKQKQNADLISFLSYPFSEGVIFEDDHLVILTEEDFLGKKAVRRKTKSSGSLENRTGQLQFSDLKEGDLLVHIQHGVGKYCGMTTMELQGAETEFIQLQYRDSDKLYIPVYKIGQLQKYTGTHSVDRLGSKSWENAKVKVKKALKDIADELIRLYAQRSKITRPPFPPADDNFDEFEREFPYPETDDQLIAISDIMGDFKSDKPMDRLVCGDVGFGKTEVAMRAAFRALNQNKQVALLVPTTVLAFQHYENFKRRFKKWPFVIRSVGRFTPKKELKETLEGIKMGTVDLVIGTHRILSSDINFAKLGLLIIDEEHRFGVAHKEKLKHLKASLDCLSLSATPIPRTLNMALMGVRDLSVINTPPLDRLPTRTFINRFNKASIRKAILAEVERGGQVYFIHNRVQSIYARAAEIREIVPEASIEVAHGQMKDGELEKVMLRFFENKFSILICTTIVENGVDNPRANTMIIDNAQNFGLSQLYQLRGRVGRSKERAYCYLAIPQNLKLDPDAKERLKVIQENTALGSGFKIAHHDLELRGAGSFLGAEQSGHANTVGYDLYLELLEQSIKEAKGEEVEEEIEPEINLRIPALIPDRFIPDIRVRLSYYKQLSEIQNEEELEAIENEFLDQFGKIPQEVINLMGVMLIRRHCKNLGIRELTTGKVNISMTFSPNTKVEINKLVDLALKEPNRFKLTPDSKLLIRMPEVEWPKVLDAVKKLEKL